MVQIDHKKFDAMDIAYLSLASKKNELIETNNRISVSGLSLANKDIFMIQTNICSTKLTQNSMLRKKTLLILVTSLVVIICKQI